MRRILVLRPSAIKVDESRTLESTPEAAADIDAQLSAALQRTPGTTFSQKRPVAVPDAKGQLESPGGGKTYAVEVEFEDEEAERRFTSANKDLLVGWYSNPAIGPFATVCPTGAVGNHVAAKARINIAALHAAGLKGKGVRLAIVDTGINGTLVTVANGLAAPGFPAPGTAPSGHGTMVAKDARLAAPEAAILDYPLLHADDAKLKRLLFDAIIVFEALLKDLRKDPLSPMVVVNSWGVHDRREDAAPGTPENYGSNPHHPFNLLVAKLVAFNADVLFAAGNCGGPCGFESCGPLNLGAGNGILGANAHPDVITVGAVTVNGDPLGYSSQGPGRMANDKPDISAPSHFAHVGVGAMAADTGTSAACGVAAGVVAALRSKPSAQHLPSGVIKQKLLEHARQPAGTPAGWNPQTGHGIVDAAKTAADL